LPSDISWSICFAVSGSRASSSSIVALATFSYSVVKAH